MKKQETYESLHDEENTNTNNLLNKLRAGVLGANDGIVSTAGIIMGVIGATNDSHQIFIVAIAALVSGALSMAVGEYVSVSSQSDAEKSYVRKEKYLLRHYPDEELEELTGYYEQDGVSRKTAQTAAMEVTKHNALRAHVKFERGLNLGEYVNPWSAAFASLISFTIGSLVPTLAATLVPAQLRAVVTLISVAIALCVTGYISAKIGGAKRARAIVRVVAGGVIAMVVTYGVGSLFGQHTF